MSSYEEIKKPIIGIIGGTSQFGQWNYYFFLEVEKLPENIEKIFKFLIKEARLKQKSKCR